MLAGTSRPTPFTFLMIELASGEGCEGVAEAARRLELATGDIQGAAEATKTLFQGQLGAIRPPETPFRDH